MFFKKDEKPKKVPENIRRLFLLDRKELNSWTNADEVICFGCERHPLTKTDGFIQDPRRKDLYHKIRAHCYWCSAYYAEMEYSVPPDDYFEENT